MVQQVGRKAGRRRQRGICFTPGQVVVRVTYRMGRAGENNSKMVGAPEVRLQGICENGEACSSQRRRLQQSARRQVVQQTRPDRNAKWKVAGKKAGVSPVRLRQEGLQAGKGGEVWW